MVSMHAYHCCGINYRVVPENYSATITIRSSIDGDVINDNVPRYRDLNQAHLNILSTEGHPGLDGAAPQPGSSILLQCETSHSKVGVTMFAKHATWRGGEVLLPLLPLPLLCPSGWVP